MGRRGSKDSIGNSSASLKTAVASELRRLLTEPGLEELRHISDFRLAGVTSPCFCLHLVVCHWKRKRQGAYRASDSLSMEIGPQILAQIV